MNLKILKNKYTVYVLTFGLSLFLIVLTFLFRDKLAELKTLGILGIFLINFFTTIVPFTPNVSFVSVVAGGNVYNPILVAFVSTLGGVLADAICYLLGRSGKTLFLKREHKFFKIVSDLFNKNGLVIIFVFALIPNPIFDALGILAGGLKYSFKKYFIAMFLGRLIRNLLLAYVGNII